MKNPKRLRRKIADGEIGRAMNAEFARFRREEQLPRLKTRIEELDTTPIFLDFDEDKIEDQ